MDIKTTALIAAAGSGTRMQSDVPKQFLKIDGIPVIAKTLAVFQKSPLIDEIVIIAGKGYKKEIKAISDEYNISKLTAIVSGGDTRQQSVMNGLSAVRGENVLIHDGVRPFITEKMISDVTNALNKYDAAAVGVPVNDTLKSADKDMEIVKTVDRSSLYAIQTPQGFKTEKILKAHTYAKENSLTVTDDCALFEQLKIPVKIVSGSATNIKITTPDDLKISKGLMREDKKMRIGQGYDVHILTENRDLIIGGVKIPYSLGLLGHSDADVLVHAIMDSLLGAAALGDIGKHFPDTDEKWKGADSIKLLSAVNDILKEIGATVVNIDATIIAQKPKMAEYIPQMISNISNALGLPENAVSVKATTTEKLGFCGRGEGIAAQAVCIIEI